MKELDREGTDFFTKDSDGRTLVEVAKMSRGSIRHDGLFVKNEAVFRGLPYILKDHELRLLAVGMIHGQVFKIKRNR